MGPAALLGVVMIGLCGCSADLHTDRLVFLGSGSSGPVSIAGGSSFAPAPPAGGEGSFRIAGDRSGLYPGLSTTLVLTVTNPQAFAIVVSSVTTTVHAASGSCPASDLSVGSFEGQLLVPARGSATTSVPVRLVADAPNACIGATFPLVYSGVGWRP
jgi:hypothetical protein